MKQEKIIRLPENKADFALQKNQYCEVALVRVQAFGVSLLFLTQRAGNIVLLLKVVRFIYLSLRYVVT